MIRKRDAAAVVGVGAACAACCTAPVAGFIAAIGLGTIAGVLIFGAAGVLAVGVAAALLLVRRHRRAESSVAAMSALAAQSDTSCCASVPNPRTSCNTTSASHPITIASADTSRSNSAPPT